MVKVTDHTQTGKRKFIIGPGRKKDTNLDNLDVDLSKNMADNFLERHKDVVIEQPKKEKPGDPLGFHWIMSKGKWLKKYHYK